MDKVTITAIDTTGIQEYVFGSNSLLHIIGASYLVYAATHDWVYKILNELGPTNVNRSGRIDPGLKLEERPELLSELVYTGGGNTVILFRSGTKAREFNRLLSRRALSKAPGLGLVMAFKEEVPWDDPQEAFGKQVQAVLKTLAERKLNRKHSTPLLGLGVTADCQYTGLPATLIDSQDENRRVSSQVLAKRKAFPLADRRLKEDVPEDLRDGRDFRYDFNQYGERTKRYLAVVHVDGNRMGARVENLAADPRHASPRAYIEAMRRFSQSIEEAAREALQEAALATTFVVRQAGEREEPEPLPFRPLVFGGDDATFVCSGDLGLPLAQIFLSALTKPALSDGKPLSGRAGVAIVKTHHPFSQAYRLAVALEQSAKMYLRELDDSGDSALSALDWHISTGGPVSRLEEIRKREYSTQDGLLAMRPVHLGGSSDWRSWELLAQYISAFQMESDEQDERRSKLKALQDALRAGPHAAEAFLIANPAIKIPPVPGHPESARTGWVGRRCAVYDSLEALEYYRPELLRRFAAPEKI